jgi:hypothetical protein
MYQKRYGSPGDLAGVITRKRMISPGVSGAGVSQLDQVPRVEVACSKFRLINLIPFYRSTLTLLLCCPNTLTRRMWYLIVGGSLEMPARSTTASEPILDNSSEKHKIW